MAWSRAGERGSVPFFFFSGAALALDLRVLVSLGMMVCLQREDASARSRNVF